MFMYGYEKADKSQNQTTMNNVSIRMCGYCKQLGHQTVINSSIASCNVEFHRFLVPQEYKCIKLNFLYHLANIISLPLLYLLYTHTKTCAYTHSLSTYVTRLYLKLIPSRTASLLHHSYQFQAFIYLKGTHRVYSFARQEVFSKEVGSIRILRVYWDFFPLVRVTISWEIWPKCSDCLTLSQSWYLALEASVTLRATAAVPAAGQLVKQRKLF